MPGAVVHPIVELEVADGELGVVQVVVERVELRLVERAMLAELGVEPLQRVEEMALPGVVQRFAEIQAHDLPFRQTPVVNGYSLFTSRLAEWTRDP